MNHSIYPYITYMRAYLRDERCFYMMSDKLALNFFSS